MTTYLALMGVYSVFGYGLVRVLYSFTRHPFHTPPPTPDILPGTVTLTTDVRGMV